MGTRDSGQIVNKYPPHTEVTVKTLADGKVCVIAQPPEPKPAHLDTQRQTDRLSSK